MGMIDKIQVKNILNWFSGLFFIGS